MVLWDFWAVRTEIFIISQKFLKSEKDDLSFIFSVFKELFEDFVHLKFGLADEMVNVG